VLLLPMTKLGSLPIFAGLLLCTSLLALAQAADNPFQKKSEPTAKAATSEAPAGLPRAVSPSGEQALGAASPSKREAPTPGLPPAVPLPKRALEIPPLPTSASLLTLAPAQRVEAPPRSTFSTPAFYSVKAQCGVRLIGADVQTAPPTPSELTFVFENAANAGCLTATASDEAWASARLNSGRGTVEVEVAENKQSSARSSRITVLAGSSVFTVRVTQAGGTKVPPSVAKASSSDLLETETQQ
jgi:hypothetical protein